MKKHFILFAMMLLPMMASADSVEIDGIYYNLVSKIKEAEVTSNPNRYSGIIEIPDTVTYDGENYRVTSIADQAFYWCGGLTSVTIPGSVTSIGRGAFYMCEDLTSATIQDGVTSIGKQAFEFCEKLTSITIPNSVTSIGSTAFDGCHQMTSAIIGNGVTRIERATFSGCGMASVTIGNSVTYIGDDAFHGCNKLTSVHISDLAMWCKISFYENESNPLFYAHHLYLNGDEIKDLIISDSITSIGAFAFNRCSGLTSVTFGNSVTGIGNGAFSGCSRLTSITIGDSLTSIGNSVFSGCNGLTSITIGNNVTSIGSSAFSGCNGLTSVVIQDSVKSIGSNAFSGCSSLTSVTIGSTVTNIYDQAFASCKELTDVYCWAENVPSTKSNAFQNSYTEYATLHVPVESIEAYRAVEPWKNFKSIVTLSGEDVPETPDPEKCATPTITFVDGKLKFGCETEDVEYVSEVTATEAGKYYSGEVTLGGTYKVSVYATKVGYENSDIVTKEFTIGANGEVCDVNKDGTVDVADIATVIDKMAQSARKQKDF